MESSIQTLNESRLSHYKTTHHFQYYSTFKDLEQYRNHLVWTQSKGIKLYILGNGSNTLFTRRCVRTLILKNELPKKIKKIDDEIIEVTSTVSIISLLKYCFESSLDSFYYLASVPATVGGALAMNAGRGKRHNVTVYDFVDSVTFYDSESDMVRILKKDEIVLGYRQTIFSGIQSNLILSARFKFPLTELSENPIKERCRWSKENQDYSGANCGSVFKSADFLLMQKLKGLTLGKAKLSDHTVNWITNYAKNPHFILLLIWLVKLAHFFKGEKAELEIILVD